MQEVLWDFKEDASVKARVYEFYHLNAEHTARTQCFHAPKMDYELKDTAEKESVGIIDTAEKKNVEIIDTVPCLADMAEEGYTLKQALMDRRTSWNFHREPLTPAEIKKYFAYSFGVNEKESGLKTYPSGGRLYPVEIYVVPTKKIAGKNAVFSESYCVRYNVHTRNIEKGSLFNADEVDLLVSATAIGSFSFDNAQMLVCLVGAPQAMKKKYHALSYRLMHDECGHMGQNMMLAAGLLGLSVVPLGGFFEARMKKLAGIREPEKKVLYVLAVG